MGQLMRSPSVQYLSIMFHFRQISGQLICHGDIPIHLTFSQEKHELAKQWLQEVIVPAGITDYAGDHIFTGILGEFFDGRRQEIPAPARSPFVEKSSGFQKRVWNLIAQIPYGQTKTYGEIARALGQPGAARAVGQACNANPLALIVPCHRVIGSFGLGGYAGGYEVKKSLLKLEQAAVMQKNRR